jgi:cell division septum initiation protein DivIVA
MTDNRLKGRVKGLFGGASADAEMLEPAEPVLADPEAERQALQVLVLARRTAEEHVATAQQESGRIRAEARAKSEEIGREARAMVEAAREEAARIQAAAQAKAVEIDREAQAVAESARRDSEKVMSDAHARAERIIDDAQAKADRLEGDALQQYEDVVGSLEGKRAALQQRIEGLQQFDREYRARLRRFMSGQLEALDADEPSLAEVEQHMVADEPPQMTRSGMRAPERVRR